RLSASRHCPDYVAHPGRVKVIATARESRSTSKRSVDPALVQLPADLFSLPRRGWTPQPRVALAHPGNRRREAMATPQGLHTEGSSCATPAGEGITARGPLSPGCAGATLGCGVQPLRGKETRSLDPAPGVRKVVQTACRCAARADPCFSARPSASWQNGGSAGNVPRGTFVHFWKGSMPGGIGKLPRASGSREPTGNRRRLSSRLP